jgi:nitroreductase
MDFIEILKKRRSIRSFLDKPVEKEKVEQLMATLQYLPSSRSIFPTAFIVVNDKEILKKLSVCRDTGAAFLEQAPVAIVVIADSVKSDVWIEDASIASTFLLLSAVELGLSGCWVQIRKRKKGKISSDAIISDILNIPPNCSVESIIAIGYADESKVKDKKKYFNLENIYSNQYNTKS